MGIIYLQTYFRNFDNLLKPHSENEGYPIDETKTPHLLQLGSGHYIVSDIF